MSKIYVVQICSGEYEDYYERSIFATMDEIKADKWCDRYNKIINDNRDRIEHYFDDGRIGESPFWYNEILYETPIANVESIELRND